MRGSPRLTREEAEEFLTRRGEDLAVVQGRKVRKRPLLDTPIWKDQGGNLLTREGDGERHVMVMFERPLMETSAELLCRHGGEVLNVGFGLGLIDSAIQRYAVRRHVIVEAHTTVLGWMREEGWMDRPNVEVIASRWEDVDWTRFARRFDGVFFDPFP